MPCVSRFFFQAASVEKHSWQIPAACLCLSTLADRPSLGNLPKFTSTPRGLWCGGTETWTLRSSSWTRGSPRHPRWDLCGAMPAAAQRCIWLATTTTRETSEFWTCSALSRNYPILLPKPFSGALASCRIHNTHCSLQELCWPAAWLTARRAPLVSTSSARWWWCLPQGTPWRMSATGWPLKWSKQWTSQRSDNSCSGTFPSWPTNFSQLLRSPWGLTHNREPNGVTRHKGLVEFKYQVR